MIDTCALDASGMTLSMPVFHSSEGVLDTFSASS